MDDDDDDLYGTAEPTANGNAEDVLASARATNDIAEDEEEDSDDEIEFTLERPETAKTDPTYASPGSPALPVSLSHRPSAKAAARPASTETSTQQPTKRARTTAPTKSETTEPQPSKSTLTHNGKEGKDYPEVRTSTIDTDADPTWPADDKRITDLDIDADLAEHSKPWRLPGTDQTDFFNYGFDEYTWTQYCARQKSMANTIGELKDEDARMKSMLGGGAMPNEADMMQMMQAMMGGGAGGMPDPSKMDFSQFGQMMGGMPGMPPMTAGGFPGQQGGASPMPQGGQGFQPPSGPSHQMDGYGQQMMPQEQQQQQGGPRRGRRGRGGYQNY